MRFWDQSATTTATTTNQGATTTPPRVHFWGGTRHIDRFGERGVIEGVFLGGWAGVLAQRAATTTKQGATTTNQVSTTTEPGCHYHGTSTATLGWPGGCGWKR